MDKLANQTIFLFAKIKHTNKLTSLTILLFALSLAFFLSSNELTRLHFSAACSSLAIEK